MTLDMALVILMSENEVNDVKDGGVVVRER